MAGVVPKRSTSGRKQWTILDGHNRGSLKGLRNQMASDGCSESQVVLAKQLLEERCDNDSEARENEELGIYWLIKASEQGNTEATNLLRSCIDSGRGITELNYLDVKNCIEMTQDEKLARKAAQEMFACLSNGGEYITSNQLRKKMLALEENPIHDKPQLDFGDSNSGVLQFSEQTVRRNEKLTQDSLVSSAIDYTHGNLPLLNNILCLAPPDPHSLDHVPLLQRSLLHPVLSLHIFYLKLLAFLGRRISFISSEFYTVLLVFSYVVVSSENALYLLPLTIYYISFVLMVIATCQMLKIKREFYDFRLWSGLFICYSGGELNTEDAEYQYVCNNLKPYYLYFGSLVVNFALYPVIVKQWLPQSELTILSFVFTFITLVGFMYKRRGKLVPSYWIFLSFGVNVLAKYPYETDPVVANHWRFLDLNIPTFASHVIGNGIEFCINFRMILYITIPLILLRIASKENWRGTYKYLLPHCVTLGWLQICIISTEGATFYGLLRGSLALVGIILFVPLVGMTSVILPVAAMVKWFFMSDWLVITTVPLVMAGSVLLGKWVSRTRYSRFITILQVLLAAVGIFMLLNRYSEPTGYYQPKELTWDVYQRFCYQPIWQEENVALAQVKCAELSTAQVNWDGYINDIKIKKITNRLRDLFDLFPLGLRNYFYCFYGEEKFDDCHNFPALIRDDCMSFHTAAKSTSLCTLQKYNSYTFEVAVRMSSRIWGKNPEVVLTVPECFTNFTLALKPNDHVWFKGVLVNDMKSPDGFLGGLQTNVKVEEIGCFGCANSKLTSTKCSLGSSLNFSDFKDSLIVVCKFVLNVILYPMINFK